MRAATYLGQNDDNSSWQQVMGADVTGEATGGLGKKKEQVRPGGKHRSGNWPLVQPSGAKTEGKRGVLVWVLLSASFVGTLLDPLISNCNQDHPDLVSLPWLEGIFSLLCVRGRLVHRQLH